MERCRAVKLLMKDFYTLDTLIVQSGLALFVYRSGRNDRELFDHDWLLCKDIETKNVQTITKAKPCFGKV